MGSEFANQPGRMLLIVGHAICLAPLVVSSVALLWFSIWGGDEWAHSLFNKESFWNFGGNPAEVFSHLLNITVVTSSVSCLCLVLMVVIWSQGFPAGKPSRPFELITSCILVASILLIWGWATYLDERSGEGTVGPAFVLFFAPAIGFSRVVARGLISSQRARFPRVLTVMGIWLVSLAMILLYEPSGTGGPNLLAFPLLFAQVGLFWFASRKFGGAAASRGQAVLTG